MISEKRYNVMDGADQKSTQDTLQYYDRNAREFIDNTVTVDFKATQTRFSSKLKKGSHILDFGCESGRDTKTSRVKRGGFNPRWKRF